MERPDSRVLPVRMATAVAAAAVTAGLVMNVGAAAATSTHGLARQCTAVADVLSDGPTVTADPVGYAEAQILPLRKLELTHRRLRRAVRRLDEAFKAYSDSNGSPRTAPRVATAERRLDAICPKAAP